MVRDVSLEVSVRPLKVTSVELKQYEATEYPVYLECYENIDKATMTQLKVLAFSANPDAPRSYRLGRPDASNPNDQPTTYNGLFSRKILSRQHAEISYDPSTLQVQHYLCRCLFETWDPAMAHG